ncbi:tyrosine-type recombinase/integrase [Pseudobutyrivibrio sp.]|uniref:tyrosine-type recombinase/integrase n=1 Tax=Pseudobutyrivibrio sp. TaxID=2014367 RepID=UPI003868FEDD
MKELKNLKKRKDGYYAKTFSFEGKRYTVYAKTRKALEKKYIEKIDQLEQEVGYEVIDDDLSEIYTRCKRGKDGRYQRTFTYNKRRYYVRATSLSELNKKFKEKKEEIIFKKKNIENPKIGDFFEKWQDNRSGYVKEATLRSQRCHFNTISDVKIDGKKFKDYRLSEIRADDIREIQKALLKRKNSTRTINDKIFFLSHIFHDAIREQYITYNPCCAVRPLKNTEIAARETIHRALTPEETRRFFDKAQNSTYFNVYKFAILTGMRIGEIGALKFCDIYNNEIHIERTLTRATNGSYFVGTETKTFHGRRVIPLNDTIKEVLYSQREKDKAFNNVDDDRVFKAPRGGLLMATPIDREISKICEETGIEHFGTHAFRDTFATRAIESGVEPRTLQELLGHADYAITMNLYVHVTNPTLQSAMNRINIGF